MLDPVSRAAAIDSLVRELRRPLAENQLRTLLRRRTLPW
jgi:hypothetical protein